MAEASCPLCSALVGEASRQHHLSWHKAEGHHEVFCSRAVALRDAKEYGHREPSSWDSPCTCLMAEQTIF